MAMTIGRVAGLRPLSLQRNGDRLTITGTILASSATDLRVAWQQLRGLADNPDEPIVPVTWDVDATVDGYYWVRSAGVAPIGVEGAKNGRFAVELERIVGGYARPVIEVAWRMVGITNPHAGITEYGRIGVPNTGSEVFTNNALDATTYITTETGSIALLGGGSVTNPLPRAGVVRYQVAPGDFYDGAATLEVLIGATWYPVNGRQVPPGWTRWRLNNGWFRFGPTSTTAPFSMTAEGWNGSAWTSVGVFDRGVFGPWTRHEIGSTNPTGRTIPGTNVLAFPQVLRNGPDVVTVRIPQNWGFETWSLARGDAFVRGYCTDIGVTTQLGIGSTTAIAVTDGVYGMVRTTAASGFKFFVSTTVDNTVDGANGRVYSTGSLSALSFAIGFSTPTTYSGGGDESGYSLGLTAQSQRVSIR